MGMREKPDLLEGRTGFVRMDASGEKRIVTVGPKRLPDHLDDIRRDLVDAVTKQIFRNVPTARVGAIPETTPREVTKGQRYKPVNIRTASDMARKQEVTGTIVPTAGLPFELKKKKAG